MGNLNTVIDFEYQIAANDYKLVQKVKDPRLGELFQLKNTKTGHIVFRKEKRLPDVNTYEMKIEEFVQQQPVKHRNLLRVYGFAGADSHEMFKNQYKIFVYFELLPDTLRDAISRRKVPLTQRSANNKKSGNFYTELELISIMKQLVDVLEYLQGNGIIHGDIRPETCYISKEGLLKVFNRTLLCSETSIFNSVKRGDRTSFLSPMMLEAIKRKQEEPIEDKYKADVWSLGLTLLESATLKPSTQIYDWNNCSINLNMLSSRLLEVKERYSPELFKIIREMISLQEEQRPDFIKLKEILSSEEKLGSNQVITDEDAFSKEAPNQMEAKKAFNMQKTQPLKLVQENILNQDAALKKRSSSDRNSLLFTKPQPQSMPKENKKEYERVGRSTRNAYFNENVDDEDVIASEGTIKINKIYERAVNRSADKFKTVNVISPEEIVQKLKKSAQNEQTDNNNSHNPSKPKGSMTERKPSYHPLTANINLLGNTNSAQTLKPSLSKFISSSSKNSIMEKQASFSKSKPSSVNASMALLDETIVTNYHVHCGSKEQYNYTDRTNDNKSPSTISVEKLVKQAQDKTDKHRMSMREPSPDPKNIVSQPIIPSVNTVAPTKSKEVVPVLNRTINLYNISPKSTPFGKSGSQPSTNFNSFVKSQDKRKISTPVASEGMTNLSALIKEKASPSTTTLDTLNLPGSFPHSPQYGSNPRPTSAMDGDVLRASHQPEIVDLVENLNEINKTLIDSIVKPAFTGKKSSARQNPRLAYVPGLNLDLKTLQQQQNPRGSSVDQGILKAKTAERKQPDSNNATGAVFFNNYYSSVPGSGVKENPRSLTRNQSVEAHQPASFQAESNYRSLREENREGRGVNTRYCRTDRQPQDEGARILAKRRAEDADIADRIEKAIERSRRTYEYAKSSITSEPISLANYSSQPVLSTSHTYLASSFNYGFKPNMR